MLANINLNFSFRILFFLVNFITVTGQERNYTEYERLLMASLDNATIENQILASRNLLLNARIDLLTVENLSLKNNVPDCGKLYSELNVAIFVLCGLIVSLSLKLLWPCIKSRCNFWRNPAAPAAPAPVPLNQLAQEGLPAADLPVEIRGEGAPAGAAAPAA